MMTRAALFRVLVSSVALLFPSALLAQTISSLSPSAQRVHELVTIRGSGFSTFQPGSDRVVFTGGSIEIEASLAYVWRDDLIQVRVPAGGLVASVPTPLPTGKLEIRVEKGATLSNAVPFRVLAGLDGGLVPFAELAVAAPNFARTKDGDFADVDGDGDPDLLDVNSGNLSKSTHSILRLNQDDGTFTSVDLEPNDASDVGTFATTIPSGGSYIEDGVMYDADFVDLDADGLPDLVQAVADRSVTPATNEVRVLINNYQRVPGSFVEASAAWLPPGGLVIGGNPDDVAHGDLDRNGYVDVAVAQRGSGPVSLLFNGAGAGFLEQVDLVLPLASPHDVFFLDANADGERDVIGINEFDFVDGVDPDDESKTRLFLNQGAGLFDPNGGQEIGLPGSAGAATDLDADGLDDFVLVGGLPNLFGEPPPPFPTLYRNDPANPGTFLSSNLPIPNDYLPYDVELGDVDLDGRVDIMIARLTTSAEATVVVLLNQGGGTFVDATAGGASGLFPGIGAYQRLSADLVDLDRDGDLDLYLTGGDTQGGTGGQVPNQLFENALLERGDCDVNADGTIDVTDVLLAKQIADGSLVPDPEQAARADVAPATSRPTDGVVDSADVLVISRAARGDPITVCSPATGIQ